MRCRLGLCAAFSLLLATTAASGEDGVQTVAPGSVVRWAGGEGGGATSCRLSGHALRPVDGVCYLPIDLGRTGELVAERVVDGERQEIHLRVAKYPYDVQRLHIDDESKVFLSAEDLKRVDRENKRIGALWWRGTPRRFSLPLRAPLDPLPAGGRFGAKRIINGQARSPHTGSDFSSPRGTPVLAAEAGVVVLAEEHFFGGNSIFLDHGDNLVSMYLHLDEILVHVGQEVKRGETIGRVGSTGRATGPHLHFGLRWWGARVDPALLLGPVDSLPSVH